MNEVPSFIRLLAVFGIFFGLFGSFMALKMPGNLAIYPLSIGLVFACTAFLFSLKKKVKCFGSYVGMGLAIFGLIILTLKTTRTPEIPAEETQEQMIKESNE